jgi:hypothetical protein
VNCTVLQEFDIARLEDHKIAPIHSKRFWSTLCIRVITNACADCSFGWTCDLRSPPEGHIIFLLTFYPKEVIGQPGDGSRVPSNDVVLGYFLVLPHRIMYLPFTRSMFSPTVSIGSGSVCIIPLYSVFPPPLFFPLLIFACSSPFLVCLQPHSLFPFETLCFLGGSVQEWVGRGMDTIIYIACLRQVVAFAPKVIILPASGRWSHSLPR